MRTGPAIVAIGVVMARCSLFIRAMAPSLARCYRRAEPMRRPRQASAARSSSLTRSSVRVPPCDLQARYSCI